MWHLTLLSLLFLRPPLSFQKAIHATSRGQTVDLNGTTLGAGELCGVYTLRCGPGLRCVPPEKDPKPLRALLEGRGRCGNTSSSRINATEASPTTDTAPVDVPDQPPCRKLLTALVKELGPQLFKPHHEVYLPNCDRDGFYKKRQCWSSRGRQRGKCWCVDENGMPLPTITTQKITPSLC